MKLWRILAAKFNKQSTQEAISKGEISPAIKLRHQGRKNKPRFIQDSKFGVSQLFTAMFKKQGYNILVEEHRVKLKINPEKVSVLNGIA